MVAVEALNEAMKVAGLSHLSAVSGANCAMVLGFVVALCRVLGIPLSKLWGFRQAPTTLNLLEGPSVDALEVVRVNDCSHHTALFGEAVHRAL